MTKSEWLQAIETAKEKMQQEWYPNEKVYIIPQSSLDRMMHQICNSIPIEWIEKYIKDHTYEMENPKYAVDRNNYTQFTEKPLDYYLTVMPSQVKVMLEEWNRKNGNVADD